MDTVNENWASSLYFLVFLIVCMIYLYMFFSVLFYLGQLSHFPSCFGAGVTNLNQAPSSCLLPPRYCANTRAIYLVAAPHLELTKRWGGLGPGFQFQFFRYRSRRQRLPAVSVRHSRRCVL